MSKRHCDWCHDPAIATVALEGINGRLCENCTAEAESEFITITITKD